MSKKLIAAIAGSCAHTITKREALRYGLQDWQASALAWAAGAAVSAAVMRAWHLVHQADST
ncbi:hypothetical protein [Streptomyces sp. RKAG293]|uniref:hypothetical protein n=1 Tax=Streptomyces sp. RKAG293 TaxID=2893403 RepID=UPI0020342772|nr:hypothetical protein [Streptomyces sp. RKAG293]MCM2416511.1 hypothetical protein [Streptomyces sp. RKAG293]